MSVRTMNTSHQSIDNITPKANQQRPSSSLSRPGSTMSKRAGTAAHEYMRRHQVPTPYHGGHRYKGTYQGAPIVDDFDLVSRGDAEDPDTSFEGLENVRGTSSQFPMYRRAKLITPLACCDGRHLVGDGHHHDHNGQPISKDVVRTPHRSQTPSLRAWSMRSRPSNTSRKASSIFGRGGEDDTFSHTSRSRSALGHTEEQDSTMRTLSPTPRKAT